MIFDTANSIQSNSLTYNKTPMKNFENTNNKDKNRDSGDINGGDNNDDLNNNNDTIFEDNSKYNGVGDVKTDEIIIPQSNKKDDHNEENLEFNNVMINNLIQLEKKLNLSASLNTSSNERQPRKKQKPHYNNIIEQYSYMKYMYFRYN